MGLGLSAGTETGDIKPIIKYDARAGRIHRIDRTDQGKNEVEITNGFAAIFDLANIEVGYVRFNSGAAPEWSMVRLGQPLPAKPAPDFKQGFRLNVKLSRNAGGDVREFASAAGCVIQAMNKLHDDYMAAPERSQGKLPVVAIANTTMVKSGSGAKVSTNYAPNFVISQWQTRPADMVATAVPPPSSTVSPPQSRPAPLPPQGNGNGHAGRDEMDSDIPF